MRQGVFAFFLKHTFDADDIAGKYLYIHNLELDQNLHSNSTTMKNSMPLLSLQIHRSEARASN